MTMKVKEVIYNWFQCGSVNDRDGAGENWSRITVGIGGVVKIIEHRAQGEGDKWYYDVMYEDGHYFRIFNPNSVEFFKDDSIF